jgi:hypothetical protein
MDEEVDWYYIDSSKGHAEIGPFILSDMRELFKAKVIEALTYIWHGLAEEWLPVTEMHYQGALVLDLFMQETLKSIPSGMGMVKEAELDMSLPQDWVRMGGDSLRIAAELAPEISAESCSVSEGRAADNSMSAYGSSQFTELDIDAEVHHPKRKSSVFQSKTSPEIESPLRRLNTQDPSLKKVSMRPPNRPSMALLRKSTTVEISRQDMPYAALDHKRRIKKLLTSKFAEDSEGSDWSSGYTDSEADEEEKAQEVHEQTQREEGWVEEITLEGHVYYRNEISREVRWEPPVTSKLIDFNNEWVWIPHSKEVFVPAKLLKPMEPGRVLVQKVGHASPAELTGAAAAKCVGLSKVQLSEITHVGFT